MKIDAHQHFWKYSPSTHSWINNDMQVLKRDFLPKDLLPELTHQHIDGCIAVQAAQTEEETLFLCELAKQYDFIKAVVGWIDLREATIEERLDYFSGFKTIAGFRHVIQSEKDPKFMSNPSFRHGISLLERFGFTYDILIYPHQLEQAIEMVKAFPKQKFVIDHLAKPNIKEKEFDVWTKLMTEMALHENVYCKLSGMVTEADWLSWTQEDFMPVIHVVLEGFGINRIMFGSDWPVCLLSGTYGQVKQIVEQYFLSFSKTDKDKLFGLNARRFYNLG